MPSTSTYAPHNLLDDVNSEAQLIRGKVRTAWNGFMDFALRDNVLEVAVGLMCVSKRSFTLRADLPQHRRRLKRCREVPRRRHFSSSPVPL